MRRFSKKMVFEFAHLVLSVLVAGRFEMPRLHERAHAAPRLDYACSFKLQIDFGNGVGVDSQIDGQLPDGG